MAKRELGFASAKCYNWEGSRMYTQMTVKQSSSYDTIKIILKAYELDPEAYNQIFRNCKKENEQTHVAFASAKETVI